MLTDEQIDDFSDRAFKDYMEGKNDDYDRALARAVEAAARAEVEPLVRQMQSALQNLLAAVRGECPGLLDEDRGGSAYLGMDADDVIAAAGAWLSPQDKENSHG